jgi:hypothetical protein
MRSVNICLTEVLSINERGLVKVITPENFPDNLNPQLTLTPKWQVV